jgi:nicotinate phosphoribosyltransferase
MSPYPECLLTDLYQLNMVATYVERGYTDEAVFELFVRRLPRGRGFLMASGLEQALDFLENLHFTDADVQTISQLSNYDPSFAEYLRGFSFTGDVYALPEGSIFFPDEPIIRVSAPLPEAQFVESRLINLLHFGAVVSSKAARLTLAAPGKAIFDFGFRRAHGAEAGVLAARSSYIAGFEGTATVAAGVRFGIPLRGTMAHSFIQAFGSEGDAFLNFARSRPDGLVLLIDTYDIERAATRIVDVAPQLACEGITILGRSHRQR